MNEKIIQGNFGGHASDQKLKEAPPAKPMPGVDSDIVKAAAIINGVVNAAQSGVTAFVIIGIKPATDGADFLTALFGDATDLRNAQEHLPGVIARLYDRKGI